MKKNHRKLIGIMLITSLLIAGCGATKSEPAPAKEEAQTQVAEAPVAEEPAAETPAAEEPAAETPAAEEQVTETQEAATAETPAPEPEAENTPEDDTVIPDGSEVTESELEDGTISTEIIKPDGSIRLILENPEGGKTVTNYDSQLYPQSKVVYDEEGNKKSESTFKYDENQLDMSWEYAIEYDENGSVAYTSETESVYSEEEGFKYGAEPAFDPEKIYPDPTAESYKYGTELLPTTSETTVKDAQGEIVKTISIDNEKREAIVKYPDGSREEYYPLTTIGKQGRNEAMRIDHFSPNVDEPDKQVTCFKDGRKRVTTYIPSKEVHEYDKDGNIIF